MDDDTQQCLIITSCIALVIIAIFVSITNYEIKQLEYQDKAMQAGYIQEYQSGNPHPIWVKK